MKTKFKNALSLIIPILIFFILIGCENIVDSDSSDISIIPKPLNLMVERGHFKFDRNTIILIDSDNQKVKDVATYFVEQFNTVSGYSLKVLPLMDNIKQENYLLFSNKEVEVSSGSEGYTIISNNSSIVLTGTPQGLFYAVQTLFQLLPNEIFGTRVDENIDWQIPLVTINDTPRFKWRGMHLDVGRHMFPVSFIKKYIDYIAMHKLNTFHWHLTEDQGWRIEIKKYPLLTEIGSQREGSQIPKSHKVDNKPYGGYYTQDEIREIVAYAEERFVTVVPEIELPGHSVAALSAYPELSCNGGPFEVRTRWGISDDIYCAGNDDVFTYLEDVLTEVIELFPSKYIHIGGDEAPKLRWKECAKCQKRIKDEGLKDEHELQNYFISRIEKFLNSKGRQIIGWDEILEGGLAPDAAVMSWRGTEGGISAAKLKHNVVMTPADYLYFCWYAGKPKHEPPALGGFLPIEKVYGYEPMPEELTIDEQKYIMGVQACLWTENIDTPELAEYMVLPRLCALAEIAWSPKEKRNFKDFADRLSTHYGRLYTMGVNYRRPDLEGFKSKNVFLTTAKVEFNSKQKRTKIYYTIDGTEPTINSLLYSKPFIISEPTEINVAEFSSKEKVSRVYNVQYIKQKPIDAVVVKDSNEGLAFKYFESEESINSTTDLLNMKSVSEGVINKFIYPFLDKDLPKHFGLIYEGFINVHANGIYTFSILSNDGSQLYVADKLVVDNDGSHGAREIDGDIALNKGKHKIQLNYFQSGGGKVLKVNIASQGVEKIEISESILSY